MCLTLYSCIGGAAILYALYRWVIPATVQYFPMLVVVWKALILEWVLDTLTQSTRPQVHLHYTQLSPHTLKH